MLHFDITLCWFSTPDYKNIKTEHRRKPLSLCLYFVETYIDKTWKITVMSFVYFLHDTFIVIMKWFWIWNVLVNIVPAEYVVGLGIYTSCRYVRIYEQNVQCNIIWMLTCFGPCSEGAFLNMYVRMCIYLCICMSICIHMYGHIIQSYYFTSQKTSEIKRNLVKIEGYYWKPCSESLQ